MPSSFVLPPLFFRKIPVSFTALRKRVWLGGAPLAENLDAPDGDPKLVELYDNMQGNILKAHGRPYSALVGFRFGDTPAQNRAFMRAWEEEKAITYTWRQLNDQWDFKQCQSGVEGLVVDKMAAEGDAPFCSIIITQTGVAFLGDIAELTPWDEAFSTRMESDRSRIQLRDVTADEANTGQDPWKDDAYLGPIDAVAILAHRTPDGLAKLVGDAWERGRRFGARIATIENGFAWKPTAAGGDLKEPFGFTDGLSNPVFFTEDTATQENPPNLAPLGLAVMSFPPKFAGGSYLVFRKLETDMKAFAKFEDGLRGPLGGLMKDDFARVIVGRKRDGQPLATTGARGRNDFDFTTDRPAPPALPKCPYHAHIRQANPRPGAAFSLVRRSMVYAAEGESSANTLGGRRGLLFLAYMRSIQNQFAMLFNEWLPGTDTLLGREDPDYVVSMAGAGPSKVPRPRLVVPRGGRYGFVPPRQWLKALPR